MFTEVQFKTVRTIPKINVPLTEASRRAEVRRHDELRKGKFELSVYRELYINWMSGSSGDQNAKMTRKVRRQGLVKYSFTIRKFFGSAGDRCALPDKEDMPYR